MAANPIRPASGETLGGSAVEGGKPLVEDIYDTGSGELADGGTGQTAVPTFPYAHEDVAGSDASRREQLAHWITSKQNQYFAKSYVNRLWGYLFGKGIIEPIDDIRAGNPPTNPELLESLTKEFVDSGFDMQHILRLICKSRVYQLSIKTNSWNEDDDINFSHAMARRLPAEVLYDTIQRTTGSISRLPGVPEGYRATQLPDVGLTLPSGFFEVFGRPARESACECERSSGMMLGPVMTLVNGPTIADAIADPQNAITKLVASQPDDAKVVDELFVRLLARPATSAEIEAGIGRVAGRRRRAGKAPSRFGRARSDLAGQAGRLGSDATPAVVEPRRDHRYEVQHRRHLYQGRRTAPCSSQAPTAREPTRSRSRPICPRSPPFAWRLLADDRLPSRGPGRAPNGNFVLYELFATAAPKADPSKTSELPLGRGSADFNQDGYPVSYAIDRRPASGWAIASQFGKDHYAVFEVMQDVKFDGGTTLVLTLDQQYDDTHAIGKFRISVTSAPTPLNTPNVPANIAAVLAVAPEQRSDAQKAEIAAHFRSLDPDWNRLTQAVAAAAEQQKNHRLTGAQDLAWALINSPAFLFNR